MRVLIVDADAAARERLRALLPWKRLGVESVAEADSYPRAAEMAAALRPDAAFVALRLGARWGCDLAAQWRAAGLRTAVCVTAERADAALLLRAMRAGARDYLTAPVSAEEAHAFLARVLREEGSAAPLPERADADAILGDRPLSPLVERLALAAREPEDGRPVTLAAVAGEMGMNGKYLGQVFLRETGMKFSRYAAACRMERARLLVTGTREKIAVIAKLLGYSQPNRFYVSFKAYFGVSPGEMRRARGKGAQNR